MDCVSSITILCLAYTSHVLSYARTVTTGGALYLVAKASAELRERDVRIASPKSFEAYTLTHYVNLLTHTYAETVTIGGALYIAAKASAELRECAFSENSAAISGGGIYGEGSTRITISDTAFGENTGAHAPVRHVYRQL